MILDQPQNTASQALRQSQESYTQEGAIGHLIARVFPRDKLTNKNIAFGAVIWDSRSTSQNE